MSGLRRLLVVIQYHELLPKSSSSLWKDSSTKVLQPHLFLTPWSNMSIRYCVPVSKVRVVKLQTLKTCYLYVSCTH